MSLKIWDRVEEKGREEGREEGKRNSLITSIKALMQTMQMTADEAMNALLIPENDQSKYKSML